jgi:hypothetical protein
MKAVISRTSAVSGMTMPAMLSAAVVDTCNSLSNIWGCVRPALDASHRDARVAFAKGVGYAPRSRREQARSVIPVTCFWLRWWQLRWRVSLPQASKRHTG